MFISSSLGVPSERSVLRTASSGSVSPPSGSTGVEPLDRLVPGDYPQTEHDLASFPRPILRLLADAGVRVAILEDGKTLADSPGLRTLDPSEYAVERQSARVQVSAALKAAFGKGVDSLDQLELETDKLTRELRMKELDYHLGIALYPFALNDVAVSQKIGASDQDDWMDAFQDLNEGLVTTQDGDLQATYGVVILPHVYHDGKAIPKSRLRNAGEVTSEYVERSLGLNRADERMVLLHEKFLPSPAPEMGNYRLATHELGHALDYTLDGLSGVPGFGATHRQAVDMLYQADLAKLASLGEGTDTEAVFTSDRADDDVREYFAEAVEAYLTPAKDDGGDFFRAGNSKEGLLDKNPALFNYLEKIMNSDFPADARPDPIPRSLTPFGTPDPDLEVSRIS